MPTYCVKTGEKVAPGEIKSKTFAWCPPFVLVFILLGGLPLIIALLVFRKTCKMSHGMRSELRSSYRNWMIARLGVFAITVAAMMFIAPYDSRAVFLGTVVAFIASLIWLVASPKTLSIKQHDDGLFYIGGGSREFLNRIETQSRAPAQQQYA